jgi:E1-E2 ATPase
MELTPAQIKLLQDLDTNIDEGLSRDDAAKRRHSPSDANDTSTGTSKLSYNVIDPPINCPAWICCLLPCIKMIPSMKKFKEIQPEDAEVLRDSKWVRYDAASLVRGDIIQIMEGDIVPADCILLKLLEDEILVDMRTLTGEDTARSISEIQDNALPRLFLGGRVLQGSAMAVVVAIGSKTLLASLIQQKNFPPKHSFVLPGGTIDTEMEIPLVTRTKLTV